MAQFLTVSFLFFLLQWTTQGSDVPPEHACTCVEGTDGPMIVCSSPPVRKGQGQSLDEAVKAAHCPNRAPSTVRVMKITAEGDVIIKPNGLANMANLEQFIIESKPHVQNVSLIMAPDEFKNTPRLMLFEATKINLPENTRKGFQYLYDILVDLKLKSCQPHYEVMKLLPKFKALKNVTVVGVRLEEVPELQELLDKSAGQLQSVKAQLVQIPTIRNTFKRMNSVKTLEWVAGGVSSIAADALHDMSKLEVIDLSDNRLSTLPDGLFSRNTELKRVILKGNTIQNLSRANFTHCPKFQSLDM